MGRMRDLIVFVGAVLSEYSLKITITSGAARGSRGGSPRAAIRRGWQKWG